MIESVYARTLARVRTCIYIYVYIDQNTFLIWEGVLADIGWLPLACIGWMNFRVSFAKEPPVFVGLFFKIEIGRPAAL